MDIRFTVIGNPITKKNSMRLVRTGNNRIIPIPSEQYTQYHNDFCWQVPWDARKHIEKPVNLKCVYFMGTKRKVDLCNLLEASCDILVDAGVLEDDNCRIVVSHDGSRVMYDKDNPRTEIEITFIADDD